MKKVMMITLCIILGIVMVAPLQKQDSAQAVLPKGYEEVARMKVDIDGYDVYVIQLKNRKTGCIKTLTVSEDSHYAGLGVALETEWVKDRNANGVVAVPYCEKKEKKR